MRFTVYTSSSDAVDGRYAEADDVDAVFDNVDRYEPAELPTEWF